MEVVEVVDGRGRRRAWRAKSLPSWLLLGLMAPPELYCTVQ